MSTNPVATYDVARSYTSRPFALGGEIPLLLLAAERSVLLPEGRIENAVGLCLFAQTLQQFRAGNPGKTRIVVALGNQIRPGYDRCRSPGYFGDSGPSTLPSSVRPGPHRPQDNLSFDPFGVRYGCCRRQRRQQLLVRRGAHLEDPSPRRAACRGTEATAGKSYLPRQFLSGWASRPAGAKA